MKKLLSLLSVLTISGTAVPTTIAASPYQKEKTTNSEINLEILNRNKRENNNILKIKGFLNIDWNPKEYFKNLCNILKYLLDNNIIYSISDLYN